MPNFAVSQYSGWQTSESVFKLCRDGKYLIDEFIQLIKADSNLAPELGDLFAIIKYVANGNRPPLTEKKFKKLKLSKKLKLPGFEAKSKHLRFYMFREPNVGLILAFGGKKGAQEQTDLNRIETLIKEYSHSKNL